MRYVAENSNSALPLFYRVSALWGAHEGSLLLWILDLSCWTVAVSIGVSRLPPRFAARVLGVLGLVSFGFLLFTLATSNPFLRLDPADGQSRMMRAGIYLSKHQKGEALTDVQYLIDHASPGLDLRRLKEFKERLEDE